MKQYFPFKEMIKKETQEEIRRLVGYCMNKRSLTPNAAAKEIGLSSPLMQRWFNNGSTTRYREIVLITQWVLEQMKYERIDIKSLDMVILPDDAQGVA